MALSEHHRIVVEVQRALAEWREECTKLHRLFEVMHVRSDPGALHGDIWRNVQTPQVEHLKAVDEDGVSWACVP